jgi:hypothetical protein
MRAVFAAFTMVLLLAGCGNTPREPPTPRAVALNDHTPREMRVVKVWDMVEDAMDANRDENVSHLIEVDVLSGPDQGKHMTLPFDEWNVGHRPPAVGDRVVLAPADWVRRDPDTPGHPPFGGR